MNTESFPTNLETEQLSLEQRIERIEKILGPMGLDQGVDYRDVYISVLDNGRLPERKTDGAIGFDVYASRLVSRIKGDADPFNSSLRRTLVDFENKPHKSDIPEGIEIVDDKVGAANYAIEMQPKSSALFGVGFVTAMPYPMFMWLTPRSGLSMELITLTNAPGTIDPDYRGETGALVVNQSEKPVVFHKEDRIAQAIFVVALIPKLNVVELEELPETMRGGGGFGSTGLRD